MTATLIQSPDRVVLKNISWHTYQFLLDDFEQEPAARLTYDEGTLEIRMPLDPHESYKKILGRLIEAATEELGLEVRSLGSRTCGREDLKAGLEPDQCYYIQNEPLVRGVSQIDLAKLPPPDLAVEVDITSSSLNRFKLYQKLKVPEIWRFDGQQLFICLLGDEGYLESDRSMALHPLTPQSILPFLESNSAAGENATIRLFRAAIREQAAR